MSVGYAMVEQFVTYFYKHIRAASARDVETMYTLTFNKIGADFFATSSWPHMNELKHLVEDDVFWILYQELYFRHLYSRDQIRGAKQELLTIADRKASWDNYLALFSIIVNKSVNIKLPNIWLWDMIDEFLYQFQSYTQFKKALPLRSPDEIEYIRNNPNVWDPEQVHQLLVSMIEKSGIRKELQADGGKNIAETDGFIGPSNVLRMLGYFSLIGLCRYNCLLGRYEDALTSLSPLNPFLRQHLFTPKIPMANINLFYYAASSYLMLKRYIDSTKCLNHVLSFIFRVKDHLRTSASYEQILKKNEQMYSLLALTVALCPAATRSCEENVLDQLKSKLEEEIRRMHNGEREAYEKLFAYGCPKYISLDDPDFENMADTRALAYKHQAKMFLMEAESTQQLPALKAYLKLYTSITIDKLTQLLDTDERTLMNVLRSMQGRIMQVQWKGGAECLSGQAMPVTDVDFKLITDDTTGQEMVVVQEQRVQKNHLAALAKQIVRFEEIVRDMEMPQVAAAR